MKLRTIAFTVLLCAFACAVFAYPESEYNALKSLYTSAGWKAKVPPNVGGDDTHITELNL